jgi:hypothetical protein
MQAQTARHFDIQTFLLNSLLAGKSESRNARIVAKKAVEPA